MRPIGQSSPTPIEDRKGRHPWRWLFAAFALFAVSAIIAFLIHRGSPSPPPGSVGPGGTRPIEQTPSLPLRFVRFDLNSTHFMDPQRGWAVGLSGTILVTTDGGVNWRAQTSGTKEHLWSTHFVDAQRGWAVGDHGTILATTDGGGNWGTQARGTKKKLQSTHLVEAQRGGWVGVGGGVAVERGGGGR